MSRSPLALALASFLALAPRAHGQSDSPSGTAEKKPIIQIALLLDTSGSMNGLIDQAKGRLWKVVNEFALSNRNGKRPDLRVALYEYGNNKLSAENHWIRQIVPFTYDLDKVSDELFKLTIDGGEEYCGAVIQHATKNLEWDPSPDAYKAIFIAGNEPFSQGPVNFRDACPAAIAKGIIVNTIFCGPYQDGLNTGWKDGALLCDGNYLNIDQDQKLADVAAPQDAEIAKLNTSLNATYIAYGQHGAEGLEQQARQDSNALGASGASNASRALSKTTRLYCNDLWDLVDACETGKVKLEELKAEDLPESLRKLGVEERRAYVEGKAAERKGIQDKLAKLAKERETFVAGELKKLGEAGEDTLDAAIIKAVRAQAVAKGFAFEGH